MLNTPILFLIFNRPDNTEKVFAEIKKIQPKQLFIAADGPRENKEGEKELCEQARKVVLDHIDWDCDVKTLFRDKNLGCRNAVSGALDWFFENVEQGIILEDDCVPSQSFFGFCEKMLEFYKNEKRIKIISGFNPLDMNEDDYFFSPFFQIWGWATWRDRKNEINWDIESYQDKITMDKMVKHFLGNKLISRFIYNLAFATINKNVNTWDVILSVTFVLNNGLSIIATKNMISNIGIEGTHYKNSNSSSNNLFTKTYLVDISKLKIKDIYIDKKINVNMFNKISYPNVNNKLYLQIRILYTLTKMEINKIITKIF